MGFYRQHVLPRVLDKAMDTKPEREIRARVCAPLAGDVVEVGFGSGLNAPFYPAAVTKIYAVEPLALSTRLAQPRIAASPIAVEFAGLTGERLELASGQFDAVLSTWTLCSIPDVDAALDEMQRVLKPGGVFHFVEHGHSPDAGVERWQRRVEPLSKRLLGGCHVTRRIPDAIEHAGFVVEQLDTYYAEGAPKAFGYTYEGRARKRDEEST